MKAALALSLFVSSLAFAQSPFEVSKYDPTQAIAEIKQDKRVRDFVGEMGLAGLQFKEINVVGTIPRCYCFDMEIVMQNEDGVELREPLQYKSGKILMDRDLRGGN